MAKSKKTKRKKNQRNKTSNKEIVDVKTTSYVLKERKTCICPRLGDAHDRYDVVDNIKSDLARYQIQKTIDNKKATLNLRGCSLCSIPLLLQKNDSLPLNILHLDLSKNRLYHCEQLISDLSLLVKLETLNLSKNHLSGKLSDAIKNFAQLEEIYLDRNFICELNPACGFWKKIKIFSASYNDLRQLPEGIGEWHNIRLCDVKNNLLEHIPDSTSNWYMLEKLLLGNNKLKKLPDIFEQMSSLQELDIRGNAFDFMPDTLLACTNLNYMNIGRNKMSRLPNLVNWGMLKELQLYQNSLMELPDSIGHLTLLRELALRGCAKLKELPLSLKSCCSLEVLDLRTFGKKESCKLQNELIDELKKIKCKIYGGIQKKQKKKRKREEEIQVVCVVL